MANTIESYFTVSPAGKDEECAKFVIDDVTMAYVLSSIATVGTEYTFSCWIKSDSSGAVTVGGKAVDTTVEWIKCSASFIAGSIDFPIFFNTVGTYYIYHPQLETGTMATDWTPSPDDVDDRFATTDQAISNNKDAIDDANNRMSLAEASLQVLADSVVTLATDDDGNTSVLQQKGTGWIFSLGNLENTVNDALDALAQLTEGQDATQLAIDSLKRSVAEHAELQDYVVVSEYNGQPCIELGEIGGEFKLRITNTEMYFMAGAMILTTVTNKKMIAEKIEIRDELQQGQFVWKTRINGNLGLTRIGGS